MWMKMNDYWNSGYDSTDLKISIIQAVSVDGSSWFWNKSVFHQLVTAVSQENLIRDFYAQNNQFSEIIIMPIWFHCNKIYFRTMCDNWLYNMSHFPPPFLKSKLGASQ